MPTNPVYPRLSGVNYESMVDGTGVRATFYLSGCSHNCPGCHNPETHNPDHGTLITNADIQQFAVEIVKRPYVQGITLSGGDPFYDPRKTLNFIRKLLELLSYITTKEYNIWIYTGYTLENLLLAEGHTAELLSYAHTLVDGPFIQELADKSLPFRGSSNQRLINIPARNTLLIQEETKA